MTGIGCCGFRYNFSTIDASSGDTEELKKCINSPFSFNKYLQKFQFGALSFQPLEAGEVNH